MKKVVISIINFNKAEITRECLSSLNKLSMEDLDVEVLVIDNASKEPIKINEKEYPHLTLTLHLSQENTGFSGGHNIGFAYAKKQNADYTVVLNNDTTVHKDLLKELVKAGEGNIDCGIIAPKIYFTKGSEFHKDRYKKEELGKVIWYAGGKIDWDNAYWSHRGVDEVDTGQFDEVMETEYASGCCFAIKKEVLEKVGGFDEKYFLYYEDSDLNERVKRAGYRILFAPKAYMWHQNAASSGGSGSSLQDYFTTRNRLLIGFRYSPLRTKLALLKESVRLFREGRLWQRVGVSDFYRGKFGKGSYRP